jgi:hypothetical protein
VVAAGRRAEEADRRQNRVREWTEEGNREEECLAAEDTQAVAEATTALTSTAPKLCHDLVALPHIRTIV